MVRPGGGRLSVPPGGCHGNPVMGNRGVSPPGSNKMGWVKGGDEL